MADTPGRQRTPVVKQAGPLEKCENGDVLLRGKLFAQVKGAGFLFYDRRTHECVQISLEDLAALLEED